MMTESVVVSGKREAGDEDEVQHDPDHAERAAKDALLVRPFAPDGVDEQAGRPRRRCRGRRRRQRARRWRRAVEWACRGRRLPCAEAVEIARRQREHHQAERQAEPRATDLGEQKKANAHARRHQREHALEQKTANECRPGGEDDDVAGLQKRDAAPRGE